MLEYEIIYSKIKNVYIQIKEGMVIVKAPRKVSKKKNWKNNRTKIRLDTKNIRKRNKETGKRTTIHKRKI